MSSQKIILVTGSSRGIGETIVKHLRSKGHIVYGSSRSIPSGSIKNHLVLDVTSMDSCQKAIERILADHGRIDVLVNNAGNHLTGAAQENTLEEIQAQMDLNFYGVVNMTKSVLPVFMEQKSGNIINVSSIGGLLSLPYTSAYNASKFALEGYSEALRMELSPFGIYVSNVIPAYVNTGTTDQSVLKPQVRMPLYEKYREQIHHIMEEEGPKGISMIKIAEVVQQIIITPKPKLRYKIGGLTKMFTLLKALVPQTYFERTVLNNFKLPLKVEY
ncbi:MAG: SDR family oxidoreductase [Leadbetterella sp.]